MSKNCARGVVADPWRRRLLTNAAWSAGLMAIGTHAEAAINEASRALVGRANGGTASGFVGALRAGLLPADVDGVRVPAGFSVRVVARSGAIVDGTAHVWHGAPDGGACFAAADGGWVYASNSETKENGGVGALRFDADGTIVDAYRILSGTRINCAGGRTPWNTWLSCEEHDGGLVWECDPFKPGNGIARPALGTFSHEACAVDPRGRQVYLTEDRGSDSGLYRFTPTRYPDLASGVLEIAEIVGDPLGGRARVRWHRVGNPNPDPTHVACRHQVASAHRFMRGEGMYFHAGTVYFTTTADHRVWAYRCRDASIKVVYDALARERELRGAPLREPDNLIVDQSGHVFVAEDSDDMQIVMLTKQGEALPLLQLVGHDKSEIAGPAFSPDGSRLYFSSQRGSGGSQVHGVTFEVCGPFPRGRV